MIEEIKEAMKKVHKHGWSNFNNVSCEEDKFVAEYDNLRECQGGLIAISETVEGATLIANTPTYIRYLLDELDNSQKDLDKAQEEIKKLHGKVHYKSKIVGNSFELIEELEKDNTAMKEAIKNLVDNYEIKESWDVIFSELNFSKKRSKQNE